MSQDDSASDRWKCNLTLVDYPPSFGEPSNSGNSEDNNTEDTTDATDDTSEEVSET